MLNKICSSVAQNKNLLMLFSTGVYIFALVASLSAYVGIASVLMFMFLLVLLLKKAFPLKYILVWTILFSLGVINVSSRVKDEDYFLSLAPAKVDISGTIASIPQEVSGNKLRFFFNVDKISYNLFEEQVNNEKVLATIKPTNPAEKLKIHDSLSMQGYLSSPFKAGNPSQFDYGNYLLNHNAYTVFYAKTYEKMTANLKFIPKIIQKINDYREKVLKVHSKYLSSPNLEILGGIVFGDDAISTPKEIKQSFVNSGLLHILAASGMNVAFIYSFFFWLFMALKLDFRFSVVLGMITMLVYTLMTGLGASVIRASIMLLFVLIGKLIDRDAHSISLLSFVALLMLIYNPMFINDVGFQLSFIVTFGILIMTPAFVKTENKFLNFLIATISVPIIAQLWVIPIQIFYFNNISLYSVFANIMSVPILMVLSFGGFVSSLLAGIPFIADFVCMSFDFILNILLNLLINISDFWGHLPNSTIQTVHPLIYQIFLYYGILLVFTGILYKNVRDKFLKPLLISFAILFTLWMISLIPIKNSNLEIITFDVGNADSFLIKTPQNKYVMVDTGKSGYDGGKSQAEYIILRFLKDKGIRKLDSVIVTHFDNDHCGGTVDILKNIKVNKLYVNDLNHESSSAKAIYREAKLNGVDIVLAKNNQNVINEKDLKITNLLGKNSDNDNENSIISLLEYCDFSMLFTGDVSISGIQDIIKFLPKNLTVLKVPHHGARGVVNKEILNYLNPKYSIISVGENKFGHPSQYTLSLLESTNILRTDINNAILIRVNQTKEKIFTYDSKNKKWKNY